MTSSYQGSFNLQMRQFFVALFNFIIHRSKHTSLAGNPVNTIQQILFYNILLFYVLTFYMFLLFILIKFIIHKKVPTIGIIITPWPL